MTPAAVAPKLVANGIQALAIYPIGPDGRCTCNASPEQREEHAGKHAIGGTVRGALKTAAEVDRTFRKHPDAEVAVRTGRGSRLCAIDVDSRHGGSAIKTPEGWQILHNGEVLIELGPDAVVERTGGGGWHFWFRHSGVEGLKTRDLSNGARAVELMGEGKCVVIAPSIHKSGARYKWIEGDLFGPLPELPTLPKASPADAPQTPSGDYSGSQGRDLSGSRFVPDLNAAISAELIATCEGSEVENGEILHRCTNPNHTDTNPSARWNAQKQGGMFHCLSCRDSGGWRKLAARLRLQGPSPRRESIRKMAEGWRAYLIHTIPNNPRYRRSRESILDVFDVTTGEMIRKGQVIIPASIRAIASGTPDQPGLAAGISTRTAQKARRALVDLGVFRLRPGKSRASADELVIRKPPPLLESTTPLDLSPLPRRGGDRPGRVVLWGNGVPPVGADVFRYPGANTEKRCWAGGIGKSPARLIRELAAYGGSLERHHIEVLFLKSKKATIDRWIEKLCRFGLASYEDGCLKLLGTADFAGVADRLGITGREKRAQREHENQRRGYIRFCNPRAEKMADGTLVDTGTGVVLRGAFEPPSKVDAPPVKVDASWLIQVPKGIEMLSFPRRGGVFAQP